MPMHEHKPDRVFEWELPQTFRDAGDRLKFSSPHFYECLKDDAGERRTYWIATLDRGVEPVVARQDLAYPHMIHEKDFVRTWYAPQWWETREAAVAHFFAVKEARKEQLRVTMAALEHEQQELERQ